MTIAKAKLFVEELLSETMYTWNVVRTRYGFNIEYFGWVKALNSNQAIKFAFNTKSVSVSTMYSLGPLTRDRWKLHLTITDFAIMRDVQNALLEYLPTMEPETIDRATRRYAEKLRSVTSGDVIVDVSSAQGSPAQTPVSVPSASLDKPLPRGRTKATVNPLMAGIEALEKAQAKKAKPAPVPVVAAAKPTTIVEVKRTLVDLLDTSGIPFDVQEHDNGVVYGFECFEISLTKGMIRISADTSVDSRKEDGKLKRESWLTDVFTVVRSEALFNTIKKIIAVCRELMRLRTFKCLQDPNTAFIVNRHNFITGPESKAYWSTGIQFTVVYTVRGFNCDRVSRLPISRIDFSGATLMKGRKQHNEESIEKRVRANSKNIWDRKYYNEKSPFVLMWYYYETQTKTPAAAELKTFGVKVDSDYTEVEYVMVRVPVDQVPKVGA